MHLKRILLILWILPACHYSWCQDIKPDDLGYQKARVDVSLLYSYNSSFSTGSPLNLYRFYHYTDYWEYNQNPSVFIGLKNAKADYEIKPHYALNVNFFSPTLFHFNLGIGLEYTENRIKSLSTESNSSAKAELFFEGKESRLLLKPFVGFRIPKFYISGNVIAGYGFSRNFETTLTVRDLKSNIVTSVYRPDKEYFHDQNVSFGVGFSFAYIFDNGINLGFAYSLYWIGISRSFEFLAIQSHGLWQNSYSISLGYDLFDGHKTNPNLLRNIERPR
jgi:hypothetical protein